MDPIYQTSFATRKYAPASLKTRANLNAGDLVTIIDSEEDQTEWGKFTLIECIGERCHLQTLDRIHHFWVKETEICAFKNLIGKESS